MGKDKGIPLERFAPYLFDNPREARQTAEILATAYRRLQRFLQRTDPRSVLWRLLPVDVPLVTGDVTETPRPQAYNTSYVGTLQDGRTKGFWVLTLAVPLSGTCPSPWFADLFLGHHWTKGRLP